MNADIKNGSGNGSKDHEAYGNYTGGLKLHYDQVIDRSGNWDVVTRPAWDVKKYAILQNPTTTTYSKRAE